MASAAASRSLAEIQQQGLKPQEQAALIEAFGFPSMIALGIIPENLTARDLFPPLPAAGFGVLFSYRAWFEGRGVNHSVVLLSCDDEAMEVLDAVPHFSTVSRCPRSPALAHRQSGGATS